MQKFLLSPHMLIPRSVMIRDLRIVFSFESNLESNRLSDSFSNLRIESAVYHARRNTAWTAGVPYSLLQAYNMLTTSIVNVCDERE